MNYLAFLRKIDHPNYSAIVVGNSSEGNESDILRVEFRDYFHVIENAKNYDYYSFKPIRTITPWQRLCSATFHTGSSNR